MIYDGVVAWLLSIEMEEVHKALVKQFGKKKAKAAELNWGACQAGYELRRQDLHEGRSLPRRADERDRGQDHHRRQHGLRAGLRVRRRYGGHLVSDHAVLFAGRVR